MLELDGHCIWICKSFRGVARNPSLTEQNMDACAQALRVYLLNEADLTFLHSLEVSEEDFSALKAEQGILVDFGSFPAKLISLLEKCIAARVQDPPRRAAGKASLAPGGSGLKQRSSVCHVGAESACDKRDAQRPTQASPAAAIFIVRLPSTDVSQTR